MSYQHTVDVLYLWPTFAIYKFYYVLGKQDAGVELWQEWLEACVQINDMINTELVVINML